MSVPDLTLSVLIRMATYDAPLRRLHWLYCKLSGQSLPWTMDLLFSWESFALRFTEQDLKTVIKFIQTQTVMGRPHRSLIFRSLISGPCSLQYFAEDLSFAKAINRQPKQTDRDSVLRATGRQPEPNSTTRSAAQVLAGDAALKQLIQLRDSL